jgi:hypothetical protein
MSDNASLEQRKQAATPRGVGVLALTHRRIGTACRLSQSRCRATRSGRIARSSAAARTGSPKMDRGHNRVGHRASLQG